jgi:hypothetical protein
MMAFRVLGLSLILMTVTAFANGRKPAVEDFVGIEIEHNEATPTGSVVLFNLENDLNQIEAQRTAPPAKVQAPKQESTEWSLTTILSLSFFASLPVLIWLLMMNHLKRKASVESASNIEVLEKYRKDREKKSEENIRKAS